MTPIEQAAAWHREHCADGMTFADIIAAHGCVGYVVATPDLFLLVRRARSYWPESLRNDPWHVAKDGDCWHVWLLAGAWKGWERFLPYPLPRVSMHRRGKLRVYPLDRFRRLKWRDCAPPGFIFGNGQQGTETPRSGTAATGSKNG
jgi:hypothetical protein